MCPLGPVGAGKTALAVQMALGSDFPFIKLCTPENMIGFVDSAKCQSIKKVSIDAEIIYDGLPSFSESFPIHSRRFIMICSFVHFNSLTATSDFTQIKSRRFTMIY